MALTTKTRLCPSPRRALTRRATACMRSSVATELPPYFCTIKLIKSLAAENKKAPIKGRWPLLFLCLPVGVKEKPLKARGRLANIVADQPLPYLTDCSVGIGTWTVVVWLPGFIGPCPSTSLDKSLVIFSCWADYSTG